MNINSGLGILCLNMQISTMVPYRSKEGRLAVFTVCSYGGSPGTGCPERALLASGGGRDFQLHGCNNGAATEGGTSGRGDIRFRLTRIGPLLLNVYKYITQYVFSE